MRLYKDGKFGSWYTDQMIAGKRVRKSLHTKIRKVAEEKISKLIEAPDGGPAISIDHLLAEFQRFTDRTHTCKTARGNRSRFALLRQYFEERGLESVACLNRQEIRALVDYLWTRRLSNATVNRYISLLKAACRYGLEVGYLLESPIRGVRKLPEHRGHKRKVFSPDEIKKIIGIAPSPLYAAFIELLYLTGARKDEVRLLRPEHVDLRRRELTFVDTKAHCARTVPLNDRGVQIVQTLLKGEYVFGNSAPAWNEHVAGQAFKRLARRCGIEGTLHDLRSTFVSRLLDNGVSPRTVQELIGDKTARMVLEIYAQTIPGSARKAVEAL